MQRQPELLDRYNDDRVLFCSYGRLDLFHPLKHVAVNVILPPLCWLHLWSNRETWSRPWIPVSLGPGTDVPRGPLSGQAPSHVDFLQSFRAGSRPLPVSFLLPPFPPLLVFRLMRLCFNEKKLTQY